MIAVWAANRIGAADAWLDDPRAQSDQVIGGGRLQGEVARYAIEEDPSAQILERSRRFGAPQHGGRAAAAAARQCEFHRIATTADV